MHQSADQKRLNDLCRKINLNLWWGDEEMKEIEDLSLKLGKHIGDDEYWGIPLHNAAAFGLYKVVEILIKICMF